MPVNEMSGSFSSLAGASGDAAAAVEDAISSPSSVSRDGKPADQLFLAV